MSTPDIETELRALIARVAEDAPEAHRAALGDLPAQVRRDHRWLRRTAPLAAAACVTAAVVAAFGLGATDQQQVGSARPTSETSTSTPATPAVEATNQAKALLGTWAPVHVPGQVDSTGYIDPPFVEFK